MSLTNKQPLDVEIIESKCIEIINGVVSGAQRDGVLPKPTDQFIEDLGADSLDTLEIVMGVEEEFDIEIPDEEVSKLLKVSDLVEYVVENY